MAVSAADLRPLYTKNLIDVYQENPEPTLFLQSFFKPDISPTKEVSIQVERMAEQIAVDIVRGTEGNRNQFAKSTEKIFEPPIYREYIDFTELDLYDIVLGSNGPANVPLFNRLVRDGASRLQSVANKIIRTKEIMCAQVFQSGVVSTKFKGSIDFKRRGTSINVTPADYFATNSDPFAVFLKGCNFLRSVGKSIDGTFNAVLGAVALSNLLANTVFTNRQNLFNMALDKVVAPERTKTAQGATFHGIITCGAYKVQLWAYPQTYDVATGLFDANGNPTFTATPYISDKQVWMFPSNPRFVMAHAAVPRLIGRPGQAPAQGEFVYQEFFDDRLAKHIMDVQTAFIAIPVAVDQLYTFQAVA